MIIKNTKKHLKMNTHIQKYAAKALPSLGIIYTPKLFLLKSSHPKKYLPVFPTPKNPEIKKLNPTKPFNHPKPMLEIGVPHPLGMLYYAFTMKA